MDKFVQIPIEWFKKDLTYQEMIILSEIVSFCKNKKYCYAQNSHFADKFDIKKASVSRSINGLNIKGYISSKIKKGSANKTRIITVNKMLLQNNKMLRVTISTKTTKSKAPSLSEITAYVDSRNSTVDPKKFFDYYELTNWDKIKNWKQKLLTWESYNKKDEKKGMPEW